MAQSRWYIDGDAYDLAPFVRWHPGGADLLHRTRGHDISTLFHTFHRDAPRFEPLLRRYRVHGDTAGVSTFRDAAQFLTQAHAQLGTLAWRETVWMQDCAFGLAILALLVTYGVLQWRALEGHLSLLPYAALMAVVRMCLSSSGKYSVMRKASLLQVTWAFLMDVDYRHSACRGLQERPFEGAGAEESLTRLKALPRFYRLPVDWMSQLLHPVRAGLEFGRLYLGGHSDKWRHLLGFVAVRGMLVAEMWWFWCAQKWGYWIGQCLMTSLLSFLLAICDPLTVSPSTAESDWASHQIARHSDAMLTGSPYIDCFLTGGLSCRRVHTLLPFQKSPFANIASEALLKQLAQEKKIDWRAPENLARDRLYSALDVHLLTQADRSRGKTLWQEHMSFEALRAVVGTLIAALLEPMNDTRNVHEKTE